LTALVVAGLLFAVSGCHEKKNDSHQRPGREQMVADAGAAEPAHPVYPPAQ